MATKHGIFVTEQSSGAIVPVVAASGLPFVVGTAPIQAAESPAAIGVPVLVNSWEEAVEKFGYSDNWATYTLCEVMYSHFKLYGCSPVVFVNLVNPTTHKSSVSSETASVANHKAKITEDAIIDSALTVAAGETSLTKGTDYEAYYSDGKLVIELLSASASYSAASLTVSYNKISTTAIDAAAVAAGFEAIELCVGATKIIPDLLLAPGFSSNSTVAAAMATKAESINGLFHAKAIVDLDCSESGAKTYSAATALKDTNNLVNESQIVCWPMCGYGDKVFHASTHVAGIIASVDTQNDGCPYESPSNKPAFIDRIILADNTEVNLTYQQANILNQSGIVTILNFIGGWKLWGNYTGTYPTDTQEPKNYFIPVSRMFDWVGNTLIQTFWSYLDKPMNRRLIDTIMDATNIWLNGLVGREYLLGARVVFLESDNPVESLMAGKIKLHIYMTPPSPAQEIDFTLEYDSDYITSALSPS